MDLKDHIAPFIAFGALGLFALWYVGRSVLTWRREGSLGVRNRVRWMPLGSTAATALGLMKGEDATDRNPIHQLRNPAVIVAWLLVCIGLAGVCFLAAVEFLRFGHGL
ncbi:MAG: hypothetical protein ACJ72L_06955 [Marmoricola sp.]